MTVKARQATPEEAATVPTDPHGLQGSSIVFYCDADHCTPEERAVIEAAVKYRETMTCEPHTLAGQNHYTAFHDLCATTDTLLAARAGKETGERS